tara:strand:- start:303 stop:731 length:429 start_codon:yes stop_codon:yes gene_type:complete
MSTNFEVHAGNGRLYKLTPEKKQKELERLRVLREDKGQAWATDDKCHDYDGFMQIGQSYINWLQEGLNQAGTETMRMNWKGKAVKTDSGYVLQIKDSWIGNGMVDLKQFTEAGGNVSAPQSAPAPQKTAAPVEDFLDDDLPF